MLKFSQTNQLSRPFIVISMDKHKATTMRIKIRSTYSTSNNIPPAIFSHFFAVIRFLLICSKSPNQVVHVTCVKHNYLYIYLLEWEGLSMCQPEVKVHHASFSSCWWELVALWKEFKVGVYPSLWTCFVASNLFSAVFRSVPRRFWIHFQGIGLVLPDSDSQRSAPMSGQYILTFGSKSTQYLFSKCQNM